MLAHIKDTDHSISLEDNVSVLSREDNFTRRKEAIEIHKNALSFNRDQGWMIQPVLLNLLPRSSSEEGPVLPGERGRATSL